MNSIAMYYALLVTNNEARIAEQRRVHARRPQRPSLLDRARAFAGSVRSGRKPSATAA